MKLPSEWREFFSLLQQYEVRYVVVGAYALAAHGRPRASQDIDIFIEPSQANAKRISQALDDFGYSELAREAVTAFVVPPRMASLGVPPLQIDIMNHIDGVSFEKAFAGSSLVRDEGLELRFVGLTELVENKKASGRTKDLLDIELLKEAGLLKE